LSVKGDINTSERKKKGAREEDIIRLEGRPWANWANAGRTNPREVLGISAKRPGGRRKKKSGCHV